MAIVTESVDAISRLVAPPASSAEHFPLAIGQQVVAGLRRHDRLQLPDQPRRQHGGDVAVAGQHLPHRRDQIGGGGAPKRHAVGAGFDDGGHGSDLARPEQGDDLHGRPRRPGPAHGRGHRHVGRCADHDHLGLVQAEELRGLAAPRGLGNDIDPDLAQDRRQPQAHQGELIGDHRRASHHVHRKASLPSLRLSANHAAR